ncbi:uncharacterized protein LOC114424629 [Glycine soja]|uniref:CCT domain-containing protein n=1 Tax=Glycine soja TaxID=3848 RepID=A0A445JFR1_GLYSO|nr:uncharacterized protein LOC114424629 [Glycine soja]KAG5000446.1 hypothetical protein JHK87_021518 [Glycine soja]RZB97286.1 hypothetical protein D0Y65_020787 [Glycine soja]
MPLSPSSMASIPQFYQNYTFTTHDLSDYPTPLLNGGGGSNDIVNASVMDTTTVWGGGQDSLINIPVLDMNNGALDHIVSLDCDTMACAANWMPSFSEQLGGFSDLAISDCKMGFYGGFQSFNNNRSYQPHVGEFGDECCGFVEDVKPPAYPNAARENWGIQGNQMAAIEEPNIKVGRYSEEERKERILRYLKKRNQRNFNKTIKYACRKTLADRRVRVRGRFARNNELCEEDMATKKHQNHHHHKGDFYGGDSIQFQLKNDEEDWLQEAMASLVYLSHSSPEDM